MADALSRIVLAITRAQSRRVGGEQGSDQIGQGLDPILDTGQGQGPNNGQASGQNSRAKEPDDEGKGQG